jgi:hypothetical protein
MLIFHLYGLLGLRLLSFLNHHNLHLPKIFQLLTQNDILKDCVICIKKFDYNVCAHTT